MFNNFSLSNDEIIKIINDYTNLIHKYAYINGKLDDDCRQEIVLRVFYILSKNRKK